MEESRSGRDFFALLGRLRVLLYPGAVAVFGFAPVGLLGPMAFAIRADLDFSTAVIGVTFALFFVGSALITSLGSVILARARAATVVRIGLSCSSLICIAMAFAPSSAYVITLSFIAGLVNGLATPATNLVLVQTLPHRRHGLGFGIKVAAVPVASSLAAFGAYAVTEAHVSWRAVFVLFGAVGLVVLWAGSARRSRGERASAAGAPVPASGRPPRALVLLALGGLLAANGTAFYTAFLVDSLIGAGLGPATAAIIVGVVGWIGIVSRLAAGIAADRAAQPTVPLRAIAVIVLIAGLGMTGLALGSGTLILTLATVACFGIGWAWPGLLHHAATTLFPGSRALAISSVQTGNYIGTVTGSLIFGIVAERVSFEAAWVLPIISVVIAAILILIAARQIDAGLQGARS